MTYAAILTEEHRGVDICVVGRMVAQVYRAFVLLLFIVLGRSPTLQTGPSITVQGKTHGAQGARPNRHAIVGYHSNAAGKL